MTLRCRSIDNQRRKRVYASSEDVAPEISNIFKKRRLSNWSNTGSLNTVRIFTRSTLSFRVTEDYSGEFTNAAEINALSAFDLSHSFSATLCFKANADFSREFSNSAETLPSCTFSQFFWKFFKDFDFITAVP